MPSWCHVVGRVAQNCCTRPTFRPTLLFGIADRTRFEYHPFGELAKVIDALGHEYRFTYTPGLQLDSMYFPRGLTEQFTYNADGNVATHVVRNGSGQLVRNLAISYDGRGRQVRVEGLPDTLKAWHSGLGHLVKTDFVTHGVTPSGVVVTQRTHDTFTNDALANIRTSVTYDSTFYNGTYASRPQPVLQTQRYATQTGRLNAAVAFATDTTLYDSAGNITFTYQRVPSVNQALQDRAYFYDAEGRLRAVDHRRFETSGPQDTPYQATFEEFRYDALGRRVLVRSRRICDHYTDEWVTLECQQSLIRRTVWDGQTELWEIQMPGADTSAYLDNDTVTVNLPRNSDGLDPHPFYGRVLYTHGLQLDQPLGITRIGYVDFKPGTPRTVFQPFTVIPTWSLRGDPDRQYLAEPAVPVCAGGFAACVLLESPMRWWAYGAPARLMDHWFGTIIENKADRSGVFYRRNRYYDQGTGRFTQEDPIGLAGGLNLYGFAAGDPVNFSDPFGLCPFCVIGIVWAGLEIGSGIYDIYNAIKTARDPDATASEKSEMYYAAAVSAIGPGGGYTALVRRSASVGRKFEKAGIETTDHFRRRLAGRGSRGITEEGALDAYNNGRIFYDPDSKNYIRYDSKTGIAVVVDRPSGGRAITVFEGNPSPRWQPVRWRPQ